MEGYVSETKTRKRVRPDSESDSYSAESKRVRDQPEVCDRVESDVPELSDILDILDEPDTVTDREPEIQDLDSVIKSFEEEILHPVPVPAPESDSGELGYLLEASDYELGLPPAISPTDEKLKEELTDLANTTSKVFGFEENVGFENEVSSYGPPGFGLSEETEGHSDGGGDDGEFLTVGGLFDYSEESEFGEFSWRPESLPAQ
ncbi:hypothetical protein LguiA_009319 [Lonicera macranthoides]